jgi:hypothetical protein
LHNESKNRDLEKEYITWINYFKRNHIFKIEHLVSPANSPSLLSNFPQDIAEKLEERLALAKKDLVGFSPGFTRRANVNYTKLGKEICVDNGGGFGTRNNNNNSNTLTVPSFNANKTNKTSTLSQQPLPGAQPSQQPLPLPVPTLEQQQQLMPQQAESASDAGYDVIIPTQLLGETNFYQLGEMLGERHKILGCRGEGTLF